MDSEAAAGADHGDGFARLDARAAQHLVGRRQRIGDDADFGRMPLVVQGFRQLDEDVGGQLDVFGVAAVAVQPDIAATVAAQRLEVCQAPAAMAAVEIEIGGHAVADRRARSRPRRPRRSRRQSHGR